MRLVAIVTNGSPEFTIGGTIGIGAIYVLLLLPGAVALAYSQGRWPWYVLACGTVVLMVEAVAIGVGETSGARAMTVSRWVLLILMLVAMAFTYAAQVAYVGIRTRRSSRPHA